MILNKKGAIFGKLNIIDFAVIIAVILMIVGISIRLNGAGKIGTEAIKVQYTVRVENIKDFTVDGLMKKGVVSDPKSEKAIGKVTDVYITDLKNIISDLNGNIVEVSVPERYTAFVTIEADVKKGEEGYLISKEQELFIDQNYNIVTKYITTTGIVTAIEEK